MRSINGRTFYRGQKSLRRQGIRLSLVVLASALVFTECFWLKPWQTGNGHAQAAKAPKTEPVDRLSLEELHKSLLAGHTNLVESKLGRLLEELPADTHWNYGNVYHEFMVLSGLLALYKDNDVERAKGFLALAGQAPTSPQLSSFGPNMLLAKALLERNEFDAVDSYLDGFRTVWWQGIDVLEQWRAEIREHKIPDFGANLYY